MTVELALVFGGGHVVLPLLQSGLVPPGWVSDSAFLAGYGAAQAVPGPLFTFAAYLGAVMDIGPRGWQGGLVALGAIFLPGFLHTRFRDLDGQQPHSGPVGHIGRAGFVGWH